MSNGEFHVWRGNVTVIPQIESAEPNGQVKFDTCVHRSLQEEPKVIQSCCGSKKLFGYKCFALGIFGVKPQDCATCQSYEAKKTA